MTRKPATKEKTAKPKVKRNTNGRVTNEFGLTPKQEKFAQIFVETGNASEAYRQAYDTSGMKTETVNRNAMALLADNKIATRLVVIRGKIAEKHAIKHDDLVEALRPIALGGDVRKLMAWGDSVPVTDPATGRTVMATGVVIKSSDQIDDATAAMISEISQDKNGTVRVKFHDKLAAVEKLGKLLGLIEEKNSTTINLVSETPFDVARQLFFVLQAGQREAPQLPASEDGDDE